MISTATDPGRNPVSAKAVAAVLTEGLPLGPNLQTIAMEVSRCSKVSHWTAIASRLIS